MAHVNCDPYAGRASVRARQSGDLPVRSRGRGHGSSASARGGRRRDRGHRRLHGRAGRRSPRSLRTQPTAALSACCGRIEDTMADMGETNHRIDDALRRGVEPAVRQAPQATADQPGRRRRHSRRRVRARQRREGLGRSACSRPCTRARFTTGAPGTSKTSPHPECSRPSPIDQIVGQLANTE